jgi:ABC-2 type transport system ATP-binding protein
VFLSSHLLDEVEKVADTVAIVDHGRVVMQGPVAEVAAGGRRTIEVGVSDPARAALMLRALPYAESVTVGKSDLRLVLASDVDADAAAAEVARRVITAGVDLRRLDVSRATLEERFLEITTRLGEAA